jgi:hypothetical protein
MTDGRYLLSVEKDGETVFSLAPDGAIVCEPENYGLALHEICQIFVRAVARA